MTGGDRWPHPSCRSRSRWLSDRGRCLAAIGTTTISTCPPLPNVSICSRPWAGGGRRRHSPHRPRAGLNRGSCGRIGHGRGLFRNGIARWTSLALATVRLNHWSIGSGSVRDRNINSDHEVERSSTLPPQLARLVGRRRIGMVRPLWPMVSTITPRQTRRLDDVSSLE
jgi:hypothetical protein